MKISTLFYTCIICEEYVCDVQSNKNRLLYVCTLNRMTESFKLHVTENIIMLVLTGNSQTFGKTYTFKIK